MTHASLPHALWKIKFVSLVSSCSVHFSCFCSGTLSYIFNNFTGSRAFSQVVKEAKEAGYTEPDPRDDLSGTDVARKVFGDGFKYFISFHL